MAVLNERLEGRLLDGEKILKQATVPLNREEGEPLVPALDRALKTACKMLDAPLPLWLDKNTKEFARFRQTFFFPDQFTEEVKFKRFHIRLLAE